MQDLIDMFNWQVTGHEKILKFLETSVEKDKLSNAYLFYGPEHVGKTLVATQFLKILFCLNRGEERPCGKCASCKQIENSIHPDIFFISREENSKHISIEQTRQMQERLSQGSFLNSYQIGVIEEAEFLNDNGWNSILKMVEEPPRKTIIILIANKTDKIPATIISRCQKLHFQCLSEDKIYENLLSLGIPRDKIFEIARIADGKIGFARTMACDSNQLENYYDLMRKYITLFTHDVGLREKNLIAEELVKKEKNAQIFNFLILLARDLIMAKLNPDLIINFKYRKELVNISVKFNIETLRKFWACALEYQGYLANNVNSKLLLENLIVATLSRED